MPDGFCFQFGPMCHNVIVVFFFFRCRPLCLNDDFLYTLFGLYEFWIREFYEFVEVSIIFFRLWDSCFSSCVYFVVMMKTQYLDRGQPNVIVSSLASVIFVCACVIKIWNKTITLYVQYKFYLFVLLAMCNGECRMRNRQDEGLGCNGNRLQENQIC